MVKLKTKTFYTIKNFLIIKEVPLPKNVLFKHFFH